MKEISAASDPTQEAGSEPVADRAELGKPRDVRSFLGAGLRDLNESDLATPAARRFLMYEIQRLDDETEQLKLISARYNDLRVEHARIEEKIQKNTAFEVITFFAATAGAAGLGAAPSFISINAISNVGWSLAIISAALVIGSALARIVK